MSENTRTDLKINGYGTAPGGEYTLVRINGGGKIDGDVNCIDFVVNGSGEMRGNVDSSLMHINGTGHIFGDVKTGELKVRGSSTFDGVITCDNATISGTATCKKNFDGQKVQVSGSVKVGGDLGAEQFSSSGLFQVGGLLSADTIDVQLGWSVSNAKEVGGENITIRIGVAGLSVIRSIFTLGTHTPRFTTDAIEGNEILLESTKANVVRGHNITVGDGCDITLVEYTGVLKKMGNARIGQEKKV